MTIHYLLFIKLNLKQICFAESEKSDLTNVHALFAVKPQNDRHMQDCDISKPFHL